MKGCIGAVDGWLCGIRVPRKNEVGRVVSFYSGHYRRYGINVQACCDSKSRFTAFLCAAPGGMSDSKAYKKWRLSTVMESMPGETYIIGDNAYSNSNNLQMPYTRPQTSAIYRNSYNFHLSQLRIRIEMAFGLLVNK